MQLYTVKMTRKQLCSRFDDKGEIIGQDEIDIPQSYYDLPLSTARSYREKFPDNNVRIIPQEAVEDKRTYTSKRGKVDYDAPKTSRKTAAPASESKKSSGLNEAARTGDMAAAINKGE